MVEIGRGALFWRASPHCKVVNLVRAGRQQPQPLTASAGGKARHPRLSIAQYL